MQSYSGRDGGVQNGDGFRPLRRGGAGGARSGARRDVWPHLNCQKRKTEMDRKHLGNNPQVLRSPLGRIAMTNQRTMGNGVGGGRWVGLM